MVDIFSVLNKQVCPRTLIACRLQLGQASVNPHAWKAEVPYKFGGFTLALPSCMCFICASRNTGSLDS